MIEKEEERVEEASTHRGTAGPTREDHADERRERFGGFNFGAAFFGWLIAVAITVLLTAIASALGVSVGSASSGAQVAQNAGGAALAAGIVLLVILAVAYFAGGYVAGRMSRFDGGRQGLGVWLIGLIISIVLAVIGAVAGAQYNVVSSMNISAVPPSLQDIGIGALIGLVVIVVVTALAALGGGKVGERYHRRVDRVGPAA